MYKSDPGIRMFRAGAILALIFSAPVAASDLVITGVVDGPLTGGLPKAVEICVLNDVPDLSAYGLGSANNGGGTDGEEFTFPAGPVSAGTFLYVASESGGFSDFFGFAPQYTSGAMSINGDDAIELFQSGAVVDVFGEINVDGTGQPWEHTDGWAYRNDGTGPDGTAFVLANWQFSGPNALDGETNNGSAATPFPIGTFSGCGAVTPPPAILLSEIVVTPTGGEYIEIHNPTPAAVDLSDVYLTDATFAPGGSFYYNVVTGADAGGGGFGDFHARFPDGASIGAGEFQTVALAGSDDFFATYGVNPTYELFEDGTPDGIPEMREALPGSINNQGGLTNSGEVVILYFWDGQSDLVADIDYAVWGDKDEAVDKTGVSVDGPDADTDVSIYLADTAVAAQDVISTGAHGSGSAFQRSDFAEGSEIQTGGNGVTGSDETSENLSVTWRSDQAPTPNAAPPAPAASWVINELLADPASGGDGDANGDGIRDSSEDEFVELVNISGADADISGWTISDGFGVRHTFPAGTVVPDGCAVVVFGGGAPSGVFGRSLVQTASSGLLGLNNGGDSVILSNGTADVASYSYGSEGGDNQSLTLDPDVTGTPPLLRHSNATTSGGRLFSPGTRADGGRFEGCPSPWVINEIHADPAGDIGGDANGDGVRDGSDDEFVEIVNLSGEDVDISGWTLSDGATLRHVFPAGSVVLDGCAVVVFGGGLPTGGFGNSLVQTASSGAVGLNNGGDTVTLNDGTTDVSVAGYGGEGGDNQSLTRDPDVTGEGFVKHSLATGSGGSLFSPGARADGSQFLGCPVTAAVYGIQGTGDMSPLAGRRVETGGVVTAVGPDGFFMQTPAASSDNDPDTSDGIFVFTGGAPAVSVGDEVEVIGTVEEFFGLTEITGSPIVNVTGAGLVPPPVAFNAAVPSPDPAAPGCAQEFECYESMLVTLAEGTVTGPNQRFGTDPVAEVFITAAPVRTFREPGVAFPGLMMPPIPTWDGNPEVFELDPDKLGLPNQIIPAGSAFSATGVLGFEFGGYELWPTELNVTPAVLPVAVRGRGPDEFTVGSLNLFRLFDDQDDPPYTNFFGEVIDDFVVSPNEYQLRLAKLAAYVSGVLDSPDILAVQEAEKLGVLEDLAAAISALDPTVAYSALLEEGNDLGGIDVGFLVRDTVVVDALTQLGVTETYVDPVSGFDDVLNDRPPLLLEARLDGNYPVKVVAVHGRSLGGIEDPVDGERVRAKRLAQAQSLAGKIQAMQGADPAARLVVVGDFNAYEFTDGYVDVLGQIQGTIFADENLLSGPDLVAPDLVNQVLGLPALERYSFIFQGSAQALDHALTSTTLEASVRGMAFGRGNADAAVDLINSEEERVLPLRSSDHDGLVLYVSKDIDGDGVNDDLDRCPMTVLPETIPTRDLGVNRFADTDGDGIFDTTSPPGKGPGREFTLTDTAGCSCEQIIEAQGLGDGHRKFGCSISAMEDWIARVGEGH